MSKYTFEKIGSAGFEQLAQALLEKLCRTGGQLIQFGAGADGAREATWSQPTAHEAYVRPENESSEVDKEWVFQAKFHDIGQRGWDRARADVESDLEKELEKVVNKYEVPCHKYILVTNVPFSGVRHVGTRDKVNAVIEKWRPKVPEIEVWDATDLSRMLDADPDTRTTFLGEILPGDILRELLKNLNRSDEARVNSYRTYLKSLLRSEGDARAEEAGDEGGLKLEKVFVDLDLALNQKSANDCAMPFVQQVIEEQRDRHPDSERGENEKHIPNSLECVPASFALLRASYKSLLIKGGPGVGKSTLTQFLSLYHAARLVDPSLSKRLAERLKLRGGVTAESLDAHCEVRFPLRIELRRYAKWVGEMQRKQANPHFAAYFAECINKESSSSFDMEDIFTLTAKNPVLLLLDGLDEVPQPATREIVFRELQIFLDRCESEDCDVNVILSTRPQGYRGEFDGFQPLEWHVVDLSRKDFDDYSDRWLAERIANTDERADARQRVADGMKSYAVQLMAKTLLQATVMLTIAERKLAIPHAKHKLYEKFVEVIFEREQNKEPIIQEKADELRRLHEKVGFELICKLEKHDGGQTLEGAEFRNCVERVILDYGRGPSDGTEFNAIVDEIVTLAKNRLCLLAGKGEDQEDIDFVIQPFREYFAAAYLARHEDADPDRAYKALSARQHVWANVLQFYAAFQSTAQQKNWISEADGSDQLNSDLEQLIEMTRRRRALIRVLPEFERPKNEYLRRAFNNLLEHSTRWTWRDRDSTAELLDAFSQNEAFDNLNTCFGELSLDDANSLFVELDLLVKADGTANKEATNKLLSDLTQKNQARSTALQVAHLNQLSVSVDSLSLSDLRKNLPSHFVGRRRRVEFQLKNWKGISDGKVIDLAVSGSFLGHHIDGFKEQWINELFRILTGHRHLFDVGVGVVFPAHFFQIPVEQSIASLHEKLASLDDCDSRSYIAALLTAIENPTDIKLYNAAKSEASSLIEVLPLESHFDVHIRLGPAPSSFESDEKWIDARNSVFAHDSKELADWAANLNDHAWMILVVPEAGWKFLDPLVTTAKLNELDGDVLSRLKIMAAGSTNIAEMIRLHEFHSNISAILSSLVTIASEIGASFLEDSEVARTFFRSDVSPPADVDANSLLDKVEHLTCPPEFCASVVSMLFSARDVDLERLVTFWKSHCQSTQFVWVHNQLEESLSALLALKNPDALRLAASLRDRHHRRAVPEIATQVATEYCALLAKNATLTGVELSRLFSLPVVVEEIELWNREDVIRALQESEWRLDSFRERLLELINTMSAHHQRIRDVLVKILQNKNGYAIEIGLAAIDAIHRLDELTSTPLTDEDWQTPSE